MAEDLRNMALRLAGADERDCAAGIVLALVYVGDKLEEIRRELWNANNNATPRERGWVDLPNG